MSDIYTVRTFKNIHLIVNALDQMYVFERDIIKGQFITLVC
jgi:hypothetical protein